LLTNSMRSMATRAV